MRSSVCDHDGVLDLDIAMRTLGWPVQTVTTGGPGVGLPEPLAALLRDADCALSPTGGACYRLAEGIVAGGPPNARPRLDPLGAALPFPLPDMLRRVYAVHDGLGPAGTSAAPFGSPRLLPSHRAAPLTRWMRFGEENILYAPAEWLRFTADARGGWCIHSTGEVRHWNEHTHELGPSMPTDTPWQSLATGLGRAP